jgi:hypothetical protein
MIRAMQLMTKSLWLRHALIKCREGVEDVQEKSASQPQIMDPSSPRQSADSILRASFEALEEFDNWDSDAETYWRHAFEGRSVPTAVGQVAIRATYYDPETACTIILVRSARLVLLLSILEHYEYTQTASETVEAMDCHTTTACAESLLVLKQSVHATIDDMLWCVPFALGDLDVHGRAVSMAHDGAAALVILQPIRLVTYCPYATCEQRSSGQHILDRLNLVVGLRSAISWEQQLLSQALKSESPDLILA